ncbi:hypothetical protein BP5796_05894 [Coleophoma crateriformis]|uniref:DNL-type domain-containing protein n=1 Tax=Coleophoma crateriformis TaxID=565419 RepID=A0A3D8RVE4_9HELO|nr:hypothetical protein BP5796_05894 [Coleophoma crateriformis]
MPPLQIHLPLLRGISRRSLQTSRPSQICRTVPGFSRSIRQFQSTTTSFYSATRPSSTEPSKASPINSNSHKPKPISLPSAESETSTDAPKTPPPSYELTFTCTPCSTRSKHTISKHGYHFGSVLVTCPECRNRHVISDHLNIFGDRNLTIEDLMKEQGQIVKKGTLSEDGDVEFWADGSMSKRAQKWKPHEREEKLDGEPRISRVPGETFGRKSAEGK